MRVLGLSDLNTSNKSNYYSENSARIRNNLADWFMGDGVVPWKMKMINLEKWKNV